MTRSSSLRLAELVAEFKKEFPQPSVMPLPKILSTISTSTSKQSDNHFFASVVMSKDLINLYHDVVLWMLKRDLLITLHLRIRVVATADLKRMARDMKRSNDRRNSRMELKGGRASFVQEHDFFGEDLDLDLDGNLEVMRDVNWLSLSPKSARKHSRRLPSVSSRPSRHSTFAFEEDSDYESDGDEKGNDSEEVDVGWGSKEDTIISDPGRATPLQRKWLSAMSENKEEDIANRFER